jgi:hypothetical protein
LITSSQVNARYFELIIYFLNFSSLAYVYIQSLANLKITLMVFGQHGDIQKIKEKFKNHIPTKANLLAEGVRL